MIISKYCFKILNKKINSIKFLKKKKQILKILFDKKI